MHKKEEIKLFQICLKKLLNTSSKAKMNYANLIFALIAEKRLDALKLFNIDASIDLEPFKLHRAFQSGLEVVDFESIFTYFRPNFKLVVR